jgi:hypothetical protein
MLTILISYNAEFVGFQMWNKIDLLFSLYVVGKGAKEWKQACRFSSLLKRKLTIPI